MPVRSTPRGLGLKLSARLRKQLIAARQQRGWSQAELAKRCALVSRPMLTKIESGERDPTPDAFFELCRAVGLRIAIKLVRRSEVRQ